MLIKVKKQKKPVSLRDFYNKRNKILVIRNSRGIGDILMCRMIFEDLKKAHPDFKIVFACQGQYKELVENHPYVDQVIDCQQVNQNDYLISYNISSCCIVWESANAPNASKNRADLWAEHCGIELQNHNMFLPFIKDEDMLYGLMQLRQLKGLAPKLFDPKMPSVLLSPFAHENVRSLISPQIEAVVKHLRSKGHFVFTTHHFGVPLLEKLGVPVISAKTTPEWCGLIHAADYVVTVDTSVFHYAGGIKKPLTGIFTHVDGKYRGKYYDFVLVQKHRDNGNWPCGPCYNYTMCSHPKCTNKENHTIPKPCLTELTGDEIIVGIEKMFKKWPININN